MPPFGGRDASEPVDPEEFAKIVTPHVKSSPQVFDYSENMQAPMDPERLVKHADPLADIVAKYPKLIFKQTDLEKVMHNVYLPKKAVWGKVLTTDKQVAEWCTAMATRLRKMCKDLRVAMRRAPPPPWVRKITKITTSGADSQETNGSQEDEDDGDGEDEEGEGDDDDDDDEESEEEIVQPAARKKPAAAPVRMISINKNHRQEYLDRH